MTQMVMFWADRNSIYTCYNFQSCVVGECGGYAFENSKQVWLFYVNIYINWNTICCQYDGFEHYNNSRKTSFHIFVNREDCYQQTVGGRWWKWTLLFTCKSADFYQTSTPTTIHPVLRRGIGNLSWVHKNILRAYKYINIFVSGCIQVYWYVWGHTNILM